MALRKDSSNTDGSSRCHEHILTLTDGADVMGVHLLADNGSRVVCYTSDTSCRVLVGVDGMM
ncbi:hypothetical protein EYF80_040884 [Liparis tanakae]|uniref:Uncharacterized protein n=1 Tax=Liparis tanakae TaxID=230148 RepID=A0A4Z2G8I8_9TELE|nr:hypothetical protein EYF80_040884 [Liparis tanakae]